MHLFRLEHASAVSWIKTGALPLMNMQTGKVEEENLPAQNFSVLAIATQSVCPIECGAVDDQQRIIELCDT
jgi:hypothetical protein